MSNKIVFIGAGSMSEAIISGIINQEFLAGDQIYVTNKNNQERLNDLEKRYNIQRISNQEAILTEAKMIILSMKPHDLKAAVGSIQKYLQPNQVLVSVVAGISTDYISNLINEKVPVIRAMPNTSASIGFSATALTKGKYATDIDMGMAKDLFETIGTTAIIAEKDMDAVTAVSGSGPAYVYYLVEAMEKAAIEAGLDETIARALITQTIVGAGEMLQHSGASAETLRGNVTSPSGTTEAGISALATYDFEQAISACIKSARDRSIELGKSF